MNLARPCAGFFRHILPVLLLLATLLPGCAAVGPEVASKPDDFGVLLMAHGGPPDWNNDVLSAIAPLREKYPVEMAFGMAEAASLQDAINKLEARGVRRIAVVRLFISGDSFLERTEQIFGLKPGAPPADEAASHAQHGEHGGHDMALWRVQTQSTFNISTQGLGDVPGMGIVLADRAAALSHDPTKEDVLILAHGPGEDAENERWIAGIDARADAVRKRLPFRRVEVQTLREDWPEKRKPAEERIRAFVQRAKDEGGTAIVIPFRVQGFGPYAEVLKGLDYVSDGRGLIPHEQVTMWIESQIQSLMRGPFR